jgi:hypothetical protein
MTEVQVIALNKAIKLLVASGVQYAIVTEQGETISNGLEVAVKQERQRAPRKYPYGELSSYYRPFIDFNANIGSVQVVPFGKYPADDIRAGVCSTLSREWGKETYVTNSTDAGVEILRMG